jgi:AsmA protein
MFNWTGQQEESESMGRILVIVGVVLALLVGAVFILPQFLPTDLYRKQIETAATSALGRDVKLTGQIHLSLIPRIEVRAGAATIANPKGFGDQPFASMKELRAAVKLWPLFSSRVEVDEFTLVEPNIALIALADGTNNWTFDLGAAKQEPKPDQSGAGFKGGALGDVSVVNGQVTYDDRAAKKIQALSKFNLKATMKALDQPFDLKASGLANDIPFDFAGKVQNPKAMLDKQATGVEIALETRQASAKTSGAPTLLEVAFKGDVKLADAPTYSGHLAVSAPNLRQVAAVAGATLPPGNVYRSFSLEGDASGSASDVALKNAVVKFDDIVGKGDAALNFKDKPKLKASLSTNAIDATPYATASGAPPTDQKPTGGWGTDPIDLSPLKLADADLNLGAAGFKFQKFDFGPSTISVDLKDGRMVLDLKQTSLFSGKGGATVVADGGGKVPQVALKANMAGLAVKPLLMAAANFANADGVGMLNIDVKGEGANLQALMSSLAGDGKFNLSNGVLNGVDLTALVKAAKTAFSTKSIPMNAIGANAQTKFSNLDGTFTMKDGVATTQDMKLTADQMTVTGFGHLDVGGQKVALTLSPQFNSKSEGVNGFGLPIKFSGSWTGINVSFDFDTLVQRAAGNLKEKATGELQKQIGKQLGLTGKDASSDEGSAKKDKNSDLKKALGGLLKNN